MCARVCVRFECEEAERSVDSLNFELEIEVFGFGWGMRSRASLLVGSIEWKFKYSKYETSLGRRFALVYFQLGSAPCANFKRNLYLLRFPRRFTT